MPRPPTPSPLAARSYDCSARPSCGCYSNATWSISEPPASLHKPEYEAVCGGFNGSLWLLAQATEGREAACDVPDIPRGPFGAVAALTIVMGLSQYLAVPPTREAARLFPEAGADVAIKAIEARASGAQPAMYRSMYQVLRQKQFLTYSIGMLLATTWTSFVVANVPIFLVYIARMEPAEIGAKFVVLAAASLGARIGCIPLFTKLILKYPKHAHPARILTYLRLLEAILTPLIFVVAGRVPDVDLTAILVVAGIVIGVMQSPSDLCNHTMIGWAIDEDGLANPSVPRREGMFYACNGLVQKLSQVIIGLVLTIWGAVGFDPKVCASEMGDGARDAIEYSFLAGLPVVSLLGCIVSWQYPIQGERLRALKEKMAMAEAEAAKGVRVKAEEPDI